MHYKCVMLTSPVESWTDIDDKGSFAPFFFYSIVPAIKQEVHIRKFERDYIASTLLFTS